MIFTVLDMLEDAGCIVKKQLHIYCPGCGGTRAVKALIRLHPVQSLYYNPAVLLLIVTALCIAAINIFELSGSKKLYKARIAVYVSFLSIWIMFFVARNILLTCGIDMLGDLS